MLRVKHLLTFALLVTLTLSACQPLTIEPADQQAEEAAMEVMDQFFEAYRTYDTEKMLSLQTDDAVWTWIDPGKNFLDFGPEGILVGTGQDEIQAMFKLDRGDAGMSGYMVWSDVRGNQVTATEIWESDWTKEIDSPLVAESTYTLRDGKIAEWVWTVSPESSWRVMNTPSSLEANRQLMTSIYEEIWNQGNLDLIDERYVDDYVRHQAGYPTELAGSKGLKQFVQALRVGFPDFHCTIEEMLAAGDKVVIRDVCQGTHTGEWNGIPATGNPITFTSTIMHQIADGKVVEDWADYDSLGWMLQLGFELTPAQQPTTSGYLPPEILVTGAYIHSPNGIKAGPDGNLYVASTVERAVLVIDPDSGEILKRLGEEVGVDGPDDVTVGPDGSVYWTDILKGSVGRLAPDGTMSSQMVALGVNPIAFSADGRLFVALAFLGDAFYELDPELVAPPHLLAEDLGGLNSFQFGPDGMLYAPVMEKGQVVRIDVTADPITIEVVAEGLNFPIAVKLDSQGRLYAEGDPNADPYGIAKVDMATGAIENFVSTPYGMDNFAFDAQDRLFVSFLGEGTIAEVKPDGSLRMLGPAGMVAPGGVAVVARPDGESIFVADLWMLQEFDSVTGEFRRKVDNLAPNTVVPDGENLLITSGFGNAVRIWNPQTQAVLEEYYDFNMPLNAVRFQGDLIVAELGSGSVVRASAADPTQRTALMENLETPVGLVADGENLWVSDRTTGNVWQLAAGGEMLTDPKLTASGLDRPEGLALTDDGRLLVAETGKGRLVSIDLATGAIDTIAAELGFNPVYPEGMIPFGAMSGVAVDPSGVIYVTGDLADVLYRIDPAR